MIEASLVIVEDTENSLVLMVENKRGINAGCVNFPGGKKLEGEDMTECAMREVSEETGYIPLSLLKAGYIEFAGKDFGVTIYKTSEFVGKMIPENDEVRPFWQKKTEIPFSKMRKADIDFIPLILAGKVVNRRYFYDADFNVIKIEELKK